MTELLFVSMFSSIRFVDEFGLYCMLLKYFLNIQLSFRYHYRWQYLIFITLICSRCPMLLPNDAHYFYRFWMLIIVLKNIYQGSILECEIRTSPIFFCYFLLFFMLFFFHCRLWETMSMLTWSWIFCSRLVCKETTPASRSATPAHANFGNHALTSNICC